ncbi:membrane protein [Lysobacter xinjiangensis]|uniref:Membrane protein n=1 Tax=Cognatilysobacter xinjiangensis TaxID=546892 RepID=A0ABQ3C6N2_9GAMM|nr:porin [Lysobacter xinjiangensis]GGZ65610.1 membrane protein [Lysobacter xinjiangensis]
MQNGFMRVTALALGIAGALTLGNAHASGFQIRENSVKNLGRANSGTAVARGDASVVSNNPAAMVNIDRATVQTDVSLIDLDAEFTGGGNTALPTPPAAPLNGNNGGDPGDLTAVPALAAVFPLSGGLDKVTVGVSVDAPFGLATEYDPNWVGRYHAIESDVKAVNLNLSAAIAITDRFSVGLGAIIQRTEVTLSNAIDFGTAVCTRSAATPAASVANCLNPAYPFRPQANDGSVSVTGDDTSFGWRVGMQWRPTDRLTIGAAHRSEIDHELSGEADFTVPGNVAAIPTIAAGYGDTPVNAPFTTPSVTTVSVQYDFSDSFRMMADWQGTDWHSLQAVQIFRDAGGILGNEPFQWKDTNYYAVGAEWDFSPAFTLRAGVARDESPTNDTYRTPRLPDNERMLYSIGATWNVSEALTVDAAYTRISIDSPTINNIHSSSNSTLSGRFEGHADLIGIAAQYRF